MEYPLIINTITVTAFTNKRVFGLILLSSILDLNLKILYRQTGVRGEVQLAAKDVPATELNWSSVRHFAEVTHYS